LAAALISGCAVTPAVQQGRPIEADPSRYRTVQVVIDAPEHLRGKNGYDITADELARQFIANVAASGKFAAVGKEPATGKGLVARLTITEFNYVSGAARGTAGILAGRAVLRVSMVLTDSENGAALGSVSVGHASHHGQGVFSPVTSGQITAIAKELSSRL
jgi:hypothetical protein